MSLSSNLESTDIFAHNLVKHQKHATLPCFTTVLPLGSSQCQFVAFWGTPLMTAVALMVYWDRATGEFE